MRYIFISKNLAPFIFLILVFSCSPSPVRSGEENPKTFLRRAYDYFDKGQLDLAITEFDKAIKLDPMNPDSYNDRGTCCLHKQEYKKAISDISKAIELNPTSGYYYFNRGGAYHFNNQYDYAIADYNKAVDLVPKWYKAYSLIFLQRAQSYEKSGQYIKAISGYKEFISKAQLPFIDSKPPQREVPAYLINRIKEAEKKIIELEGKNKVN